MAAIIQQLLERTAKLEATVAQLKDKDTTKPTSEGQQEDADGGATT